MQMIEAKSDLLIFLLVGIFWVISAAFESLKKKKRQERAEAILRQAKKNKTSARAETSAVLDQTPPALTPPPKIQEAFNKTDSEKLVRSSSKVKPWVLKDAPQPENANFQTGNYVEDLQRAFIFKEILDKPLSLRGRKRL